MTESENAGNTYVVNVNIHQNVQYYNVQQNYFGQLTEDSEDEENDNELSPEDASKIEKIKILSGVTRKITYLTRKECLIPKLRRN